MTVARERIIDLELRPSIPDKYLNVNLLVFILRDNMAHPVYCIMRRKLRITMVITILLILAFVAASILLAADYKYVGSRRSNKYHYPWCQWAKKINPHNLVTFRSVKEAQEAGYIPCKVCKPPLKDE